MTEDTDPAAATGGLPRQLTCPQCAAAMDAVPFRDITVDRCTECHGLWFDALERDHLDALAGSEGLDVGPAGAAAKPPAHMACPVCHSQLITMVEPGRADLHYHSCTVCYGLFTPAGEYREHRAAEEHPALAFFHRLFHGKPA